MLPTIRHMDQMGGGGGGGLSPYRLKIMVAFILSSRFHPLLTWGGRPSHSWYDTEFVSHSRVE